MAQWLMKHLSLCLDKACELRSCQKESFSALEAGKERESRCGDGEREREKEGDTQKRARQIDEKHFLIFHNSANSALSLKPI